MAEVNPPLYLDQDDAYGAAELGLPYRDIMGEGVVGATDLQVTANTGLKSSVAAGAGWIKGDDDTDAQPTYRFRNDAAVLLQHDAADATNPRIDLVVARVKDSAFSGVSKLWELALIKGTPASSPAAPALPGTAIALAKVTIPAGSGTLGTITDLRSRATVGGGAALNSFQPVVYRKRTTTDVVSTTTPTDVLGGAITVGAGTMGTNKTLRARLAGDILYSGQGSAQPFTVEILMGGVSLAKGNTASFSNAATRSTWALDFAVRNLNDHAAQDVSGALRISDGGSANMATGLGSLGVAAIVGEFRNGGLAVDTSVDCTLVVKVTNPFGNSTCSFRCLAADVEVF